jgi:hypothetical protein
MTQKKAAFLALGILILVGIGYLYQTSLIAGQLPPGMTGPVQFPIALGIALIALCAIEILRELRRAPDADEARLEVPNAGKLGITIALIAAYFWLWSRFGLFYPLTFVFFMGLLVTYRQDRGARALAMMAAVSAIFVLFLYLVFQLSFGIRLG